MGVFGNDVDLNDFYEKIIGEGIAGMKKMRTFAIPFDERTGQAPKETPRGAGVGGIL